MFTQKMPISGCSQNISKEWAHPVIFIDFLMQYFQFNWVQIHIHLRGVSSLIYT